MEFFDNTYCICGKLVIEQNEIYCCENCKISDNGSQTTSSSTTKNSAQVLPPVHLQFSITITPNVYKASDSNSKYYSCYSSSSSYDSNVSSSSFTSVCTLDHDFNENYDYVYTRSRYHNKLNNDEDEDDFYISQLSSSNPIPIPSSKTVNHELEPNKGTFGKESTIY